MICTVRVEIYLDEDTLIIQEFPYVDAAKRWLEDLDHLIEIHAKRLQGSSYDRKRD